MISKPSASKRREKGRGYLVFLHLLLLLLIHPQRIDGSATCESDDECKIRYGSKSICREDQKCTFPDIHKGCLQSINPLNYTKRVCNSADPRDAGESGLCREPDLPYQEIRLYGGNWESRVILTWLAQIILSELLGVPTTVEGGVHNATLNLYNSSESMRYGLNFVNSTALRNGNIIKNCTEVSLDADTYQPCAHAVLETWDFGSERANSAEFVGVVEATPTFMGMTGMEAFYVTQFTVRNDTSLGTYLGLQGEDNRQKLAETFLRPTTWKDYCEQVSINNCTSDDGVAKRYPQGGVEEERMFMEGVFTGHFRATEENDCSLNNETFKCTGHVGDYPCAWVSFLEQQTYHLNISLQSSGTQRYSRGYTQQQLKDMWYAANGTKSNLMMYWFRPDPLYYHFENSHAKFSRVSFPPPTQTCEENRIPIEDTCNELKAERVGSSLGACSEPLTQIRKLLVSNLQEITSNPKKPESIHSPAYDVLRSFLFSEHQLGEIFQYTETEPSLRHAVCRWAYENLDFLKTFVPHDYPRKTEHDDYAALSYATVTIAAMVAVLVCATAWMVHREQEEEKIKLAQTDFLQLLLVGALLISVGAILTGLKATKFTCIASIWFVDIGYTLELVPLIVKVAAICKISAAARKMQRVVLGREKLYGVVGLITFLVLVYLAVWTGVDPPQPNIEYRITDQEEDDFTIVSTSDYCRSDTRIWAYVSTGWNFLLLFIASVWAFQMRQTHSKLNETATLAFLIYSHFIFVMFRVVTFVLSQSVEEVILRQTRSLIYSVDTLATILIYFVPKFAASENISKKGAAFTRRLSRAWSTRLGNLSNRLGNLSSQSNRQRFAGASVENQGMAVTASKDAGRGPQLSQIAEAPNESHSLAMDKSKDGSTFVKVDKAGMVAVKDALVSMEEVHEEADAEVVVSKMIDFIVSFRASQVDPSAADATETVCLLNTGEGTQGPGQGDTQSEHGS